MADRKRDLDVEVDLRLAAGRSRLLQRVQRRQRIHRAGAVGAAALILGLGLVNGVGGAVPGVVAARVTCYTAADLTAPHDTVRLPAGASPSALTAAQQRRLCDDVWRSGDATGSDGGTEAISAAMCRLVGGAIAVFPIDDRSETSGQVCHRLGLTSIA
ncbi:hypothetical protein [Amnibacterium endophyticum]|uniref:Subtilisin inhibitor domain-containing protein n=1 Tax=Amnibacterium endophyticum TaxID=2109337 RepID=A0ABW4LJH0_9MICO